MLIVPFFLHTGLINNDFFVQMHMSRVSVMFILRCLPMAGVRHIIRCKIFMKKSAHLCAAQTQCCVLALSSGIFVYSARTFRVLLPAVNGE